MTRPLGNEMHKALGRIAEQTPKAVEEARRRRDEQFKWKPEDYRRFRLYRVFAWKIPEAWSREPDFDAPNLFDEIRVSRAILFSLGVALETEQKRHLSGNGTQRMADLRGFIDGEDFILDLLIDAAEAQAERNAA